MVIRRDTFTSSGTAVRVKGGSMSHVVIVRGEGATLGFFSGFKYIDPANSNKIGPSWSKDKASAITYQDHDALLPDTIKRMRSKHGVKDARAIDLREFE